MRSTSILATACAALASALLAGCGPTSTPATSGPTAGAAPPASSAPSAPATPAVKSLTQGNCTLYQRADAVKLLGGVNMNNKAIDIQAAGGTKIDVCSYINVMGVAHLQGVSYAVVRYDSPATAYAKAKQVRSEMIDSAIEHDWAVQPLSAPVPGAGPLLGGYGTKTDSGMTYTIAVVGTNVGPYLVAALGASSEGAANAKRMSFTVFQALATAVG